MAHSCARGPRRAPGSNVFPISQSGKAPIWVTLTPPPPASSLFKQNNSRRQSTLADALKTGQDRDQRSALAGQPPSPLHRLPSPGFQNEVSSCSTGLAKVSEALQRKPGVGGGRERFSHWLLPPVFCASKPRGPQDTGMKQDAIDGHWSPRQATTSSPDPSSGIGRDPEGHLAHPFLSGK